MAISGVGGEYEDEDQALAISDDYRPGQVNVDVDASSKHPSREYCWPSSKQLTGHGPIMHCQRPDRLPNTCLQCTDLLQLAISAAISTKLESYSGRTIRLTIQLEHVQSIGVRVNFHLINNEGANLQYELYPFTRNHLNPLTKGQRHFLATLMIRACVVSRWSSCSLGLILEHRFTPSPCFLHEPLVSEFLKKVLRKLPAFRRADPPEVFEVSEMNTEDLGDAGAGRRHRGYGNVDNLGGKSRLSYSQLQHKPHAQIGHNANFERVGTTYRLHVYTSAGTSNWYRRLLPKALAQYFLEGRECLGEVGKHLGKDIPYKKLQGNHRPLWLGVLPYMFTYFKTNILFFLRVSGPFIYTVFLQCKVRTNFKRLRCEFVEIAKLD
ncbi:uncharacterized protein BDR25DRAFT_350266 [Lindgomyces ingoldianus]|uniref:Uncharacterized protein n=1 Tax=Lindgomyces ingoldianus TaxID=673940 RepID=A0ACB6RCD9_9PLEO|nr:uncharacterized protein BDR25DRAFT_350266 [Lindgomyces ingoldianus]KAF2475987.1 hypothetical protein BDR25DRAFT_350266 [Lindgomyces ingoldianus]